MNIVFATPEAIPFAKTGGLADVSGALPIALKKLGLEVTLFLPLYRHVLQSGAELKETGVEVTVPLGRRSISAPIFTAKTGRVGVYFLRRDELYDRTQLYSTPEGDYFDNIERFAFFSRGVVEAIKALGIKPDVIHCNDWQTGLVPAYLRDVYKDDPLFRKTAKVFTIHNVAYQGIFPGNLYDFLGLGGGLFTPEGLEFWGNINLLKAGVCFSDIITTVSPTYSKEIQTPEYGWGLDGLFRARSGDLFGVLNGVDYSEWDPRKDTLIPEKYSARDLKGKEACKRELIREFGLKTGAEEPVIGMITRLAGQKGFDILAKALPGLMKLPLGLVILGTGEMKFQKLLERLESRFKGRLSIKIAFDNRLAHLIEAGSDLFLMPSRYEPCGLNQIYSLRYGTIPVVRGTGGLKDTVRDFREDPTKGTGFVFGEYSSRALLEKVKEAIEAYGDKKEWGALQKNAMEEDFSWERSAEKYREIYTLALKKASKGKNRTP